MVATSRLSRFGLALSLVAVSACTRSQPSARTRSNAVDPRSLTPNYYAGPADKSKSVTLHKPKITVAHAFSSAPFRDIPDTDLTRPPFEHEPLTDPNRLAEVKVVDPVVQSSFPNFAMPGTTLNFLAQGTTLGGCIFPKPDMGEPPKCTTAGDPPDTNGAVGPNHFVQSVNSGIAVWSKSGALLMGPKYLKTLWAGYAGTNPGNACATENDGDPVVLYDQFADRWFITQFSLPNYRKNPNNPTGPSFQCVAVSQTGDPTGAYNLYDFQYSVVIPDYGKFSVWNDAYYAAYNNFDNPVGFLVPVGTNVCAFDRAAMLAGNAATQQCIIATSNFLTLLPSNADGQIKPPDGEPASFVGLNSNSLDLYSFHVDWATPSNTTVSGPTNIPVAAFNTLCGGGSCVPEETPGNNVGSLGDRPMFHLSYRNFGTHESLVFNHSIATNTGGPRWYEIRSPNGTPTVFQQGTFAPDSTYYRWMGSIAQDQAQDMVLGYSISNGSSIPGIAWTGRLGGDATGKMTQGEALIDPGAGVEIGTFSNGQTANRWGDYSNMTVDPTDDCTFWYTTENYPKNGTFNWDTYVASVKFPSCAANDFTISLSPSANSVMPGASVTYTVTTASSRGTAESIALNIQDLPTGVTGSFAPASVTAGGSSTLTLTALGNAPNTSNPAPRFMVIGKATSAVHAATALISVGNCQPKTSCPPNANCGTVDNGCGGTLTCGPACALPQTCGGGGMPNVCGCTPKNNCPIGSNCGTVDNGCGGLQVCGTCTPPQTCGGGGMSNVCGCTPTNTCQSKNATCGSIDDGCGKQITCPNSCTIDQQCVNNMCVSSTADLAGTVMDLATAPTGDLATSSGGDMMSQPPRDLSVNVPSDLANNGGGGGSGGNDLGKGGGGKGGCGCRVGGGRDDAPTAPLAFFVIALSLGGVLVRRRARASV